MFNSLFFLTHESTHRIPPGDEEGQGSFRFGGPGGETFQQLVGFFHLGWPPDLIPGMGDVMGFSKDLMGIL